MTRDEVRAWAATLDDSARVRWLTLLDALDWERARADKAEADAAAMRVALFSGIGVVSIPRCVVEAGSYCGTEEMPCACDDVDEPVCRCGNGAPCDDPECIFGRALDGTAGRALLAERDALRARVAELEARRAAMCSECGGNGTVMCNRGHGDVQDVDRPTCGGTGAVWVSP